MGRGTGSHSIVCCLSKRQEFYLPLLPHTRLLNDVGFLFAWFGPSLTLQSGVELLLFIFTKSPLPTDKASASSWAQNPMEVGRGSSFQNSPSSGSSHPAENLGSPPVLGLGSHIELPWTSEPWFHFTSRTRCPWPCSGKLRCKLPIASPSCHPS